MIMRIGLLISLLWIMSGCLRTREDIKEVESTKAMRDQVDTLQKVHADSSSRLEELMDQNRQLNGRIEELEQKILKNSQAQGAGKDDLQKSLSESRQQSELLKDGIVKLENQVQALQEEIVTLKTKGSSDRTNSSGKHSSSDGSSSDKAKDKVKDKERELMDSALAEFQESKWKEAILNFDHYREKFPKGKYVAEATYKTGVSFQELGMRDEAKVFYNEVIEKFPKTEMSKKAQLRLKSLGSASKK